MADILDQFIARPKAVDADRHYLAFKALDKRQLRLRVRPAADVWDRLPYRILLRIMELGKSGTSITLVYSFMAVQITGKNLSAVADAIERENCDFIEEFDPLRHDGPGDEAAPFIEKIVLHAAAGMETVGQPTRKRVRQEETA